MANEAVIVELTGYPPGIPINVTVSNAVAISKGTLLVWTDPRNVVASSGAAGSATQLFAGIAAADKQAGDGSTTLAMYTQGIFDLTSVAGTVNNPLTGYDVELSGANLIRLVAPKGISGAEYISGSAFRVGKSLENASASEVILVRVRE